MRLFLSSGDIVLIRLIYGIINQPAHPNLEALVLVKLSLSPSSTSSLPAFVPTATFLSPFRANRCDTRTVGNNYSFVHYYKYRVLLLSLLPGWQLDCCDSHPLPPKRLIFYLNELLRSDKERDQNIIFSTTFRFYFLCLLALPWPQPSSPHLFLFSS